MTDVAPDKKLLCQLEGKHELRIKRGEMSREGGAFSTYKLNIALYMYNDNATHNINLNFSRPQCIVASLLVISDKIMLFSMTATSQICNLASLGCRGKRGLDVSKRLFKCYFTNELVLKPSTVIPLNEYASMFTFFTITSKVDADTK